jgi:phage terminase large subunit-like protein
VTTTRTKIGPSLGWAAIDWIEHFLVHGPGDIQGEPIALDDEFAAFVVRAYEIIPRGPRKVRRAVISRPKGRAKSEFAAMFACFEALGPSRFDHFAVAGEVSEWGYAYEEGEPVGRRVQAPEILCFATELGQAGNTYDAIMYMLDPDTCSAELRRAFGRIDVGLTRINVPGGGSITPESAADSSKDGGKSTFVVTDETHLWVLPRLKRLHQVVLRNLLKRRIANGWMLETTTMYAPGEGSVAEGTHQFAQTAREGRVKASLLFDHCEADDRWDLEKRAERIGALKQVYGPAAGWMDLEAIADSWDDPQTSRAEWERYWLNRPKSLQGNWLSQHAWEDCISVEVIPDGSDVILALDGSFSGDATALVAVWVGDDPHVIVAGLWERTPHDPPDWRVPVLDVEDRIRDHCLTWNVLEIVADPYRWRRTLELLESEGLPVVEFPQSAARMTPATTRVSELVHERQMTHDGDPALSRHVANAVLRKDARGVRIYKEHKHSAAKIDLAVAMLMGIDRACWWAAQPVETAPTEAELLDSFG